MILERRPFTPTRLEEERALDRGRVISVRFNEDELRILEAQKLAFDTSVDGAAIKLCWLLGWKVLQHDLGDESLRWLSRRDRSRIGVPDDDRKGYSGPGM